MPVERLTPERRRARTREHLLEAAADVFAARGFHASTLDEIADAAGFSKGAVYSNFANKEDLILAVMLARSETIVATYEGIGSSDDVAALADVYLRANLDLTREWALFTEFDLYALRKPELRVELNKMRAAIHDNVVALLERQWAERAVESPMPAADVARVFMAIFEGLWRQKALDPDSVPDDLAARAIVLVNTAIEPRKRRRA